MPKRVQMEKFSPNIEKIITNLNSNLYDVLKDLEDSRLRIVKNSNTFLYISVTVIIGFVINFMFTSNNSILFLGIVLLLVGFAVYYFWIVIDKNHLIIDFNDKVVPHIINEFLTDSHFDANAIICSSEYWRSDLFKKEEDRYSGDSFISGVLGKTFLQFSRLHTEYERRTRKSTTWVTIFKGVFLVADSNKRIENRVYILPDSAEWSLGGIGKWMQERFGGSGRGEMVYLEDPEFERRFVVYATDPVEARYLLTPNMQHYFVQLSDHIGGEDIHASFIDGRLYLALSGRFELFSFWMRKSLLDPETMRHYCQNLCDILSVIEILDLNTRIWGK